MELLAQARVVIWEGGALWVVDATRPAAPGRSTDLHAHHAIQVTIGLGGRFRLETTNGHVGGEAVAVAADVGHTFQAEGLFAILFAAPESRLGRAITARFFQASDLSAIPRDMLGDFPERIAALFRAGGRNEEALIAQGRGLISHLAADVRADVPDLRVRKVIAWAGQRLDGPLGLVEAAAVAGLSAGRLRHLFVEHTGLPFKSFVLWLRLMRALERFAAGRSLTEAAHEAGFSDSAHLSRTFRRMFGVAPAGLRMT